MSTRARHTAAAAAIAACVALLAACGGDSARTERIAHGAYLAQLMGCPACHTAPGGPPYAGGLTSYEPEGAWRAPNITPHAETGIGRWTDTQIAEAIRAGAAPGGRALHPIMPVRHYRRLTDEDMAALLLFLRSLAPVDHAIDPLPRPTTTAPPLPAPTVPPPPGDARLARGEYLAAIMHCASCHATPGAAPTHAFAGGKPMRPFGAGLATIGTGTLYAGNLTPDRETGLGAWSAADLARSVRLLVRPDGTTLRGPMQLYAAGWSALTEPDATALGAYLAQLPPIQNPVPPATFAPALP